MIRLSHTAFACNLLVGLLLITGCDKSTGPELGQVKGRVTLNGQPLEGARIIFWPGEGRPSVATTDGAGRYELRYTTNQNGALVGNHQVRISTAIPLPDDTTAKEVVPAEFNTNSTLVREVKLGRNEYDFDISE